MRNLSIDDMPSHLREDPLHSLISIDLQLYAQCPKWGEETRFTTALSKKM